MNRTKVEPSARLSWVECLCMRQRTNGVIVEIQSSHCASGDSPRTSVLCANRFQMGFEKVECITRGSCSNHLSRFLDKLVEVHRWLCWRHLGRWSRFRCGGRNGLDFWNSGCCWFDHRFRFVVKQCWLALKCHFNDFCCCYDFCRRHQFAEFKIFIPIIMVDGLCKNSFPVSCTGFFHDLLDLCFAEGLGRLNNWHFFNFHRFYAAFAPRLKFGQRWVTWEEHKGSRSHFIGTDFIANPLEEDGEVGRCWRMFFIEVETNLEGLSSATGILLGFEQDASVEPSHVTRRVECNGFVESHEGFFWIVIAGIFFTFLEQGGDLFFDCCLFVFLRCVHVRICFSGVY